MTIGKILFVLVLLFAIGRGVAEFRADYEYQNTINSYWDLSEKASTLKQKSKYLDKYVAAIKAGQFAPNNATIYPTPNNALDQNMIALESLQGRMHQIEGMDESSFAYQTAIQQITQQEQGEAHALTSTFEGCWYLQNHYFLWGWHDDIVWGGIALILLALIIIGLGSM